MNTQLIGPSVRVTLGEITVGLLMALRDRPDESIAEVTHRLAEQATVKREQGTVQTAPPPVLGQPAGKYSFEVLGRRLHADTLGGVFAEAVDVMDDVDPKAVVRLSTMRATKRRYVSRDKAGIHGARADLKVMRTRSGWWVDGNISRGQLVSALQALCRAAGLEYGSDIRFPA